MPELTDSISEQLSEAIRPFKSANRDENVSTTVGLDVGVTTTVSLTCYDSDEFDHGLRVVNLEVEGDNGHEWVPVLAEWLRDELVVGPESYPVIAELGDVREIDANKVYPCVTVLLPTKDLYANHSTTYELTFSSGKTREIIIPDSFGDGVDEETIRKGIRLFWWDSLSDEEKLECLTPNTSDPLPAVDSLVKTR